MEISWKDFEKVEMRVGTIIEANEFPEARKPAYKLKIDFGKHIGFRKTSAQITKNYRPQDLVEKEVIVVINFPDKQIANFMSECLVLGVVGDHNDITLIEPGFEVENGMRIG